MRRAVAALLFLIAFAGLAFGQDDWFQNKPIEAIRFVGLSNIPENDLTSITAQFIGKPFRNNLFFDLQSKIFALDYFEEFDVAAVPANDEKSAVILEFTVVERPVVETIEFLGNQFIRRQDLLDEILIKEGDIATVSTVRADAQAIRSLYLERGFPDVVAEGRIERISDTGAEIIFEIEEGSQRKIEAIRFSGNTFASESTLKRVMSSKERSLFASGVFQEANVAADIEAIETYYRDRGYVDARVIDVVREATAEETNDLILTYYLEEGVQYTYGGISFEGNSLYSDERLESVTRQVEGALFSRTRFEADFMRIYDIYATDGYIFNTITRREVRDEQNRRISFVISIVERSRAHIENIILNGNEKTDDEVILRELPFDVGDIYSQRKLVQGYQNLLNLQFFSAVLPDTVTGSADGLVDIIFDLEEGRTTDINFGVTFSGVEEGFPIVGFLKWTDNNFRGLGQEFSIGTEIAAFSQKINFGFQENWLFGRRWSGGVDLSAEHAVTSGIPQDALAPIFAGTDRNRVPDPYTGIWVWADGATDGVPGTPFDGSASELAAAVDAGTVVTDYTYAVSTGTSTSSGYSMKYDSWDLSLGVSTGYTFVLPEGRLGLGTRLTTTLAYIDYDENAYRPFDETIRLNHGKFLPITTWLFNLTFDSRDIVYNPSKGVYLRESVTLAGGFLPSTRDFIKTSTKAQAFFTLFDVPVVETWNLKGVLAINTGISFVLDQFVELYGVDRDTRFNATTSDLLYIDGMSFARGWPRAYDGRALWNSWIELRMPIVEQYLWFDTFVDATGLWTELADFAAMSVNDYLFGFGGGIRLTVPGLPIGLYLTKRFKIADGAIAWQGGNIFQRADVATSGIDLVIAFSAEVF
jgi:outer membrane protein insertion porin family